MTWWGLVKHCNRVQHNNWSVVIQNKQFNLTRSIVHKSSVWLTHPFTSVSLQQFSNVKTPPAARHNAVKICRLTALAQTTDAAYHHAVTLPGRRVTLSQLYFSKHACRSFTAFHCCKIETSRKQMCYIRTRSSKSVNHTFCIAGKCKKPLLAHFGILLCCCMSSRFLCAFQMGGLVLWCRELKQRDQLSLPFFSSATLPSTGAACCPPALIS